MSNAAFYAHFDRHAHGKGLKGASTHYCPGCGHGLIHKYVAEAIAELGIEDRTVMISPVGCSVFLHYYFDTGNVQAAHGRAPAVGLGVKLAHPESIVVSYQGDGDLAAIGLAEIIHCAQLALPFSVIFVNNAIYGMTGGQMAPTTLMEQISTTSPYGRSRMEGFPLRMSEMIAGMEGPIYVERVALYDLKTQKRARRAITKAIQNQIEGRGFSFVEVLSECPVHLKMTGPEASVHVREKMEPIFPLGIYRDVTPEAWFKPAKPAFEPERLVDVLDATSDKPPRFANAFPAALDPEDISLKLAGAGGDGAQTAALLITRAAVNEGFDATHIPSYGPESRGGTSFADVHVALREVLSPASPRPHILVAFNAPSLARFGPTVREGGTILYDSSVVTELPALPDGVRVIGVPFATIALELGKPFVKNMAALGALQAATRILPEESFFAAIKGSLKGAASLMQVNEEAFLRGAKAAMAVERV